MFDEVFTISWFLVGAICAYRYIWLINPELPQTPLHKVSIGVFAAMCSFMGILAAVAYGITLLALAALPADEKREIRLSRIGAMPRKMIY